MSKLNTMSSASPRPPHLHLSRPSRQWCCPPAALLCPDSTQSSPEHCTLLALLMLPSLSAACGLRDTFLFACERGRKQHYQELLIQLPAAITTLPGLGKPHGKCRGTGSRAEQCWVGATLRTGWREPCSGPLECHLMLAQGATLQIQTCFRCLMRSLHPACSQILIPAI